MKLYIVFWWNSFGEKWAVDSVHKSYEVAEAKMRYERMENPRRPYFLDEVDAPDGLSWDAAYAAAAAANANANAAAARTKVRADAADKEASADPVRLAARGLTATDVGQR